MTNAWIVSGLSTANIITQGYTVGNAAPIQSANPAPLLQGFLRGPIITQGYSVLPPGPTGWILLESGWKLLLESGDAYLIQATGPPAPTPGTSGWFLREDNWRILLESGDYFLIESVNPVPPPGSTGYILLENGWRLLLENGSAYLLENANQAVPSVFPDPQKASWNIKNTPSSGVVVNYEIYQGIGTDYYVTQGYGVPGTVYFVSPGKATWAIKVASPLKSSWNLKKS